MSADAPSAPCSTPGGPYGAVGVDLAFEQLLCRIFGEDFITTFKRQRPAAWVDLTIAFEARKRTAGPHRAGALNISLPFSFIDFYRKQRGHNVETALRRSRWVPGPRAQAGFADPEMTVHGRVPGPKERWGICLIHPTYTPSQQGVGVGRRGAASECPSPAGSTHGIRSPNWGKRENHGREAAMTGLPAFSTPAPRGPAGPCSLASLHQSKGRPPPGPRTWNLEQAGN